MPFIPKDWRDGPIDTSTPLSAAALEDLELRLSNYPSETLAPDDPGPQPGHLVATPTVVTVIQIREVKV
jgi:hypothetical protein